MQEKIMANNQKKYNASESDIAVIGISCRFPGAKDANEFWENLQKGRESVSFFSENELENGSEEMKKSRDFVRAGFVLEDSRLFDADFFGFSERDAKILDPQHRKFLECSWEALEDSGYNPDIFKGSIGVFAGSGMSTYLLNNVHPNVGYHPNRTFLESMEDLNILTANDRDYLATRVSYKFNLRGPSVNVQTACSTSLVAIHLACQSILNGECDMALAGAVTILCPQKTGYLYQPDMILSPDGHCRPFDTSAKGTVFGSGVGVVLLKKLKNALKDGDAIHAVIRGTAVNNDGSVKVGYSAPSIDGQAAVIEEAMAVADVLPEEVSFIEGHGTATKIGDLVEISSLKRVFKTDKKNFCAIGSVKSNIGHLGWASGMAGFIKAILAIKNEKIPPTINFEKSDLQLDIENSPFYINKKNLDWKTNNIKTAGVSAFGLGGTNAHVIISESLKSNNTEESDEKEEKHLFTLSARNESSLRALSEQYIQFLSKENKYISLGNLCYTSNIGRKHFEKRIGFISSSLSELRSEIKKFAKSQSVKEYFHSREFGVEKSLMDEKSETLIGLRNSYESGGDIDWLNLYSGSKMCRVHLPTYQFQKKEYWISSNKNSDLIQKEIKAKDLADNFYEVRYENIPRYGTASRHFISVRQLKKKLRGKTEKIALEAKLGDYKQILDILEKSSFHLIVKAFYELGFKFDQAEITTEEFMSRFNVSFKYKKLVDRLFEILQEENIVKRTHDYWKILKIPDIKNVLLDQNEDFPEFELLSRCGFKLSNVLRGSDKPLDLLFKNGDTSLLKNFYTNSPTLKAMNSIVAEAVSELQKQNPKNTGLKILEIGAGTGSTTKSVIQKLFPDKTAYVFTDLSAKFTFEAKKLFVDYAFMSYTQLDIEKQSENRDSNKGQYDVIIATNVLHATKDLRKTITNANALLAKGGILILLEGSSPVRWVDITFGLIDGWWRFSDYELRPSYPLLSPQKWKKELLSHGFSEVEAITSQEVGSQAGVSGGMPQAVIFAKKINKDSNTSVKNWVVFSGSEKISGNLIRKLEKKGINCITVQQGEVFKEVAINKEYEVNVFNPEDFNMLLSKIQVPVQKILYLWTLDKAYKIADYDKRNIENYYLLCCGGLLNIVKSVVDKFPSPPPLVVVTEKAQIIEASSNLNQLIQSSIWGFCRVIAIEHPELSCKIIDIESIGQTEELSDELFAVSDDDGIILKSNSRYVARLENMDVNFQENKPFVLDRNATYVITGGFGGLGLKVAGWMANAGARHIALLGRELPAENIKDKLISLTDKGVDLKIEKCDISDYDSLKKVFHNLRLARPIRGIVHVAGVIDDGVILQQSFSRLLKPAKAKVIGSWNLHTLSKEEGMDLDFFVLFSSVVSVIGNVGQSNHASANNFMNSLALYRKYNNLPATVIQWGAWADIGTLAKFPEVVDKLNAIGIKTIKPDDGIKVLDFILSKKITSAIYAPMDWRDFIKSNKLEKNPFFSSLFKKYSTKIEKSTENDILTRISSLPYEERLAVIQERILENVDKILDIQDGNDFENKNFFEYGMDSLTSIQLRNNLQHDFKCSMHPTIVYKYPTIKSLSGYVINSIFFESQEKLSNEEKKKNDISSRTKAISMQQKRWIRLANKGYGKLLIPILFHTALNKEAFLAALKQVIDSHEVLKYKFPDDSAEIVECDDFLSDDSKLFVDASNEESQAQVIIQQKNRLNDNAPNPKDRPTWTIKCIKLNENKFLVLLHIQHLEFDGTSVSIFVDDLRRFYADYIRGVETSYLPVVQYADYVEWQKNYMISDIDNDRDFFKRIFGDIEVTTFLPNHSGSKNTESYPSSCYTPNQINGLWKKLQLAGMKSNISPFSIICSTYAQLIGWIIDSEQVIIGTIVSSRPSSEFDRTIGPFVQPFPLKVSVAGNFKNIVDDVHDLITEINDRSRYPVADMVNYVPAFRNMEIDTYFTDAFVMLNNYPRESNSQPRVEVLESLGPIVRPGLPDLSPQALNEIAGLFMIVDYYEGEMRFNFWYHKHRFRLSQIKIWAEKYLESLQLNLVELSQEK